MSAVKHRAGRPLLIVDGDSFAHRAFHALPKTIRRSGNKGGGAIVGFANTLIRLYEAEAPRAVIVGWDTLDKPTYRSRAFPDYQSGRVFDPELLDQLKLLPKLVEACGFANAKAAGFEADDFLAAAVRRECKRGGEAIVASGDRDAFQLASDRTTILYPVKVERYFALGQLKCGSDMGLSRRKSPTSSHCAATPLINSRELVVLGQKRQRAWSRRMEAWKSLSEAGVLLTRQINCGCSKASRQWTRPRRCLA